MAYLELLLGLGAAEVSVISAELVLRSSQKSPSAQGSSLTAACQWFP